MRVSPSFVSSESFLSKMPNLAGEFVRLAAEADFPEGCDRGRVLTIGLKALYGELSEYRKER